VQQHLLAVMVASRIALMVTMVAWQRRLLCRI
jgi:hypothetical protein